MVSHTCIDMTPLVFVVTRCAVERIYNNHHKRLLAQRQPFRSFPFPLRTGTEALCVLIMPQSVPYTGPGVLPATVTTGGFAGSSFIISSE